MATSQEALSLVRKMYAGVLADAVKHMGAAGVLAPIQAAKRQEQLQTGKMRAAQLGITRPQEAFTRLSEIFDCADWEVTPEQDGFTAQAQRCMLCVLAQKMKAPSPCRIYCLDPLEGLITGIEPNARMQVEDTLYRGQRCRVRVSGV